MKDTKKTKAVVSVKLDDTQKSALALQAEKEGLSLSDFLRKKLSEEKSAEIPSQVIEQNTPAAPANVAVMATELSTESLIAIDELLTEKLVVINTVAPEREYLKKLAGQSAENPYTLSFEEENFLKILSEGIKAETVEGLLLEHNSVPIAPMFANELQKRKFFEMLEKRNEVLTEKMPSFNKVFMDAIAKAFLDDCRALYNRNLFNATYGFSYDQFKAVFEN
jgi:hypothetical protein